MTYLKFWARVFSTLAPLQVDVRVMPQLASALRPQLPSQARLRLACDQF